MGTSRSRSSNCGTSSSGAMRGETPGMTNMIVKVMRLVLSYAVENEYR